MSGYPKRLIEVDLPIKKISAHARREKSIRHGHISTLHIWWARRPLAACRAVLCAALWPDPVDEGCPQPFRDAAARELTWFAEQALKDRLLAEKCDPEAFKCWQRIARKAARLNGDGFNDRMNLRHLLLAFIADFANWDNCTRSGYLTVSRNLTQAAHEALGGIAGTNPLVVDPFAGGGAIPLEALRVGADAFASDLNPVAVLLNKVVLEYIPRYGQCLAGEVRKWGQWVKEQAEKELIQFYPKDPDGATPIAYVWARTVTCEGPGCGAEVPLIRSFWLARKGNRSVALRLVPDRPTKRVKFEIIENVKAKDVQEGTVRRGSATCQVCGFTTPVASVRNQLKARRGGATDARLLAVVTTRTEQQGRFYRLPTEMDLEAVASAAKELERRADECHGALPLVPNERISLTEIRRISVPIYGMELWGDLLTPRQALALTTLARLVRTVGDQTGFPSDDGLDAAVKTCLALAVDRQANALTSLGRIDVTRDSLQGVFARQAVGMVWDFAEASPLSEATGGFDGALQWVSKVCDENIPVSGGSGQIECASATAHPLPDDAAGALITDPPYYDAVPYAHLSDFFYVWLRRMLSDVHPTLLGGEQVPKDAEIVVDRPHELSNSTKDVTFYERELTKAFAEARRVVRPDGIGTIVFASKTTASWEAILQAVVDAGWTITGSWPIDTEMETRVAAQGQARLGSSVHLVCRPREAPDGSMLRTEVGEWRDVLAELPHRIHEWMPRLGREGVVGADAIFACLGPALEIFSRYSKVEKASGVPIELRHYLEHVWAAVAREALSMIFVGADTTGFEDDARLTAVWFWVQKAENGHRPENHTDGSDATDAVIEDDEDREEGQRGSRKTSGYGMPYDTARKLAQGLGADLVRMSRPGGVVTITGNVAVLNGVAHRENALTGLQNTLFGDAHPVRSKRTRSPTADGTAVMRDVQGRLDALFDKDIPFDEDPDNPVFAIFRPGMDTRPLMDRLLTGGTTMLDRLHQAMLLFARDQTSLLRPFLSETSMGADQRFWRLAQALSVLYPPQSDEKRWVDGVLARKKGLGF